MTARIDPLARAEAVMAAAAMGYPEVREDHPWGERAFKVRGKKVFLFMSRHVPGALSLSLKLPVARLTALALPFAEPTGYGLGASGWVTATFKRGDRPPVELLLSWLNESYRAVAPVKLGRTIDRVQPILPEAKPNRASRARPRHAARRPPGRAAARRSP